MSVSKEASSLIRRPEFLIDAEHSYAIKMVGDTMSPRFRADERLYVDPDLKPENGWEHVFYSPDRRTAHVRTLLRYTAEHWIVEQLNPRKEGTLSKKAWPFCERIIGTHRPT